MVSRLSFVAAILTLSALLPIQAQMPKPSDKKTGASTAPTLRFSIYGAVAKPGIYRLKPGDHIENALSDAAGPTLRADLGAILVIHTDKAHNAANGVWTNFNDFILHGKTSGNPLVQPGDDIYVLSKGSRYKPLSPEFVNL